MNLLKKETNKLNRKKTQQQNGNLISKEPFRQQPVIVTLWKVEEIGECDWCSAGISSHSVGDYILTTAIGDSKIFSIVCKSRRDLTERKVDCFVQPNSQHADIERPFLYTKFSASFCWRNCRSAIISDRGVPCYQLPKMITASGKKNSLTTISVNW